jgi:hypothetical protein
MGLIDDKKNVFTTIGAYTSLNNGGKLPTTTNTFTSVNNKNEIIPLLLDVLKIVVGSEALQELTGQLFSNLVDKIEPDLKTGIKKQNIQSNSGDKLPSWFVSNGVSVPVKNIDINGKLKTNPNSNSGSLLYDNSKPNFDGKAYQAIQNSGTDTTFGNMTINYNSNTDSFIYKPTNPNQTIGDFTNGFVDSITVINKKEFMSNVMNQFYGSISNDQNKTADQLALELQISKLIEQVVNGDNSFTILPSDLNDILNKANDLVNGNVNYDMGCGIITANLPLSGLTNVIASISGSTDPTFIGNQLNNTIDNSANSTDTTAENKQTIKDGFFQTLINLIKTTLAQAVSTTPQIRTILAIVSAFQNNGVTKIGNPIDDLKNFSVFINCNVNSAMKLINEFIYNLIITFLIALLQPIIRTIVKEKINQYIGILKSLVNI